MRLREAAWCFPYELDAHSPGEHRIYVRSGYCGDAGETSLSSIYLIVGEGGRTPSQNVVGYLLGLVPAENAMDINSGGVIDAAEAAVEVEVSVEEQ